MQPVIFSFSLNLQRGFEGPTCKEAGSVGFHRWYPHGPQDAIALDTGYPDAVMRVWFSPKDATEGTLGVVEGYLENAEENELTEIGLIWSGPLHGTLTVESGLSGTQIAALNRTGNDVLSEHEEIAKFVVDNWIAKPIAGFVKVLRSRFGHYWLEEFEKWDSRQCGFGSYCGSLNLKVSTNGGKDFRALTPGENRISLSAKVHDKMYFQQYVTREDWRCIPRLIERYGDVGVALSFVSSVHELLEAGRTRHALLDAITALEAAIQQRVKNCLGEGKPWDAARRLVGDEGVQKGARLKSLAAFMAAMTGASDAAQIDNVLTAIDERNRVVHDGEPPPESVRQLIRSVLDFVLHILKQEYRFVGTNTGNIRMSKDKWDAQDSTQ